MADTNSHRVIKCIIPGIIMVAIGFVILPRLLKMTNKKIYKHKAKVTEKDFINNKPIIVKKGFEEDIVNDN